MLCEAVNNSHWFVKDTAQYEKRDEAPVRACATLQVPREACCQISQNCNRGTFCPVNQDTVTTTNLSCK